MLFERFLTLVGDDVYGHAVKGLKGQLLHSFAISFIHPRSEKEMKFEISLPKYFEDYLLTLKKYD